MNKWLLSILALCASTAAFQASSEPVDLTGYSCERAGPFGSTQIWDFYGDIAVRRYSDASLPQRFVKVGQGAYEKYDRIEGEWDAIFYFFEEGDEVMMQVYSRPGLLVRNENPRAPWTGAVFPFAADCRPISQANFYNVREE